MNQTPGCVYLIGAGPGDPELISCKGKRVLEASDTVVYDALVNTRLVDSLPDRMKRIFVGKRGGKPSIGQEAINRILAQEAKKGKTIARLKGGDPLVFGRGSEEMEYLRNRGIRFEVVPGITSALAAPAFAGIPVTHRAVSRSVALVTGHLKSGDDIGALEIPSADTLVFLMAMENLAAIVKAMLAAGRFSPSTPAALVQDGTLPSQKAVIGTLDTILRLKDEHAVKPPAVFIVGEVVRLGRTLAWLSRPPLAGARVAVLRTSEQSGEITALLESKGATVIRFPLIRIRPRAWALARIDDGFLKPFTMLIFTSPNAVTLFMQAFFANAHDARGLAGKRIFVLGSGTEAALKPFGIVPDAVPKRFVAEKLLDLLPRSLSGENVLIPRASAAREILPQTLRLRGAKVTVLPVYDTVKVTSRECPVRDGDYVLFTSSSMVESFFDDRKRASLDIVPCCIGEITAATLRRFRKEPCFIAKNATMRELVKTVERAVRASGTGARRR